MTVTDRMGGPAQQLLDEREVVDALYRFAAGQDDKDTDLFLSAFTSDAVLDFSDPARRFGIEMAPMEGIEQIAAIPTTLAALRTTHSVSNPQVSLDRDTATLRALVEAQHVRNEPPQDHLLLKNVYDVEAVRDADAPGRWRITHMVIRNIWHDGRPDVLFGGIAS